MVKLIISLNAFSRSQADFAAKNAIFRSLKSANFVKNFAIVPNFAIFIKSRQKSIFSSRRRVLVILSVSSHKRNPLEPTHALSDAGKEYVITEYERK